MNNKKLKSIVFSMVLAAGMLLPANASAQETTDRPGGLFSTNESLSSRGLFSIFDKENAEDEGITNDDFGAPLGSGIAIMLGAGLGYVALKKKEDKQ